MESAYLCTSCKRKYPFGEIRYASDGKRIVCKSCFSTDKGMPAKSSTRKNTESDRVKVICSDCRYKFVIHKGTKVSVRCPYCSGAKLVRDDATADTLLAEASEMDL
jgi:DNA-directed RNA polymerase subunit RPC12/RpoP